MRLHTYSQDPPDKTRSTLCFESRASLAVSGLWAISNLPDKTRSTLCFESRASLAVSGL